MTWVIGAAAILGYAVGISDVRVTFTDGSEKDCLQKLYPISRFIAAGFAGSVRIGFTMLDGLVQQLSGLQDDEAWIPEDVALAFSPLAQHLFRLAEPLEQALQSHLMLLSAHPTEDVGIPGRARCFVHILRSPEFVPKLAGMGEVVSIGSGSSIGPYQEVLAGFSSNIMSLLQGEIAGPGMGAMPLTFVVRKTIEKTPVPGVSSHAHICLVRRGSVSVFPNDETRYPPTGEVIEIRMPPVATNWEEFVRLVAFSVKSPHGAKC